MGVKVREKPRASGIYWVFINHHGKRKSKKIGTDKKLANEVAEKIKAKLVLGELNIEKLEEPCPTFKENAQMWLSLPHDWKESTREIYSVNLDNHVLPIFGSMPINEIKRKDLKSFFDKKYAEGLDLKTIKVIRVPINGTLSYAVELELIESNPMRDLELKYKKKEKIRD